MSHSIYSDSPVTWYAIAAFLLGESAFQIPLIYFTFPK